MVFIFDVVFIFEAVFIFEVVFFFEVIFIFEFVFIFEVIFIFKVVFYLRWLNYRLAAPDALYTALKPMATLEISTGANSDRQRTEGWKKPIIRTRTTALPKNGVKIRPRHRESEENWILSSFPI